MEGGRARWTIENEVFNTLKNQVYNFEHNFGHGYKNLSHVFVNLMLCAFLIDQAVALCCEIRKQARNKYHANIVFWSKIKGLFLEYILNTWEDIYLSMINGYRAPELVPDTS